MVVKNKTYTDTLYKSEHIVEESQGGMRLDQFVQVYLPSFSREQIKKKIASGEIFIQKRPGKMKSSTKIIYQDLIEIRMIKTTHEDEWWNGEKLDIEVPPEIIFEDEDLLVIEKPAFMSTHPAGKHIFYCATVHFEKIHNRTIHSIHRLDRETSGVLLLAKNPPTANIMTEQFEKSLVKKSYFFIAKINDKYIGDQKFKASENLGSPGLGIERVIVKAFPKGTEGKLAETFFEVIHIEKGYAIGVAHPQTGRQHQIRVHAAEHGLPLIGDKLYLGGYAAFQRFKDNLPTDDDHLLMEIPRQALHSIGLRISYNQEIRHFIGTIPYDLKNWITNNLDAKIKDIENLVKEKVDSYFSSID